MLFVAAAGNNGQDLDNVSRPSIPASFDLPNILSVAAVDNTGQLASFSNYGETSVDVAAPGVDIASTFPDYDGNDAGYYWLSGTSMAAPHVSAIAALVGSQAPTLLDTPTDLKKRILDTAKNVGDTGGLTLTGRMAERGRRDRPHRSDGIRAEQLRLRHRHRDRQHDLDARALAGGHRRPQRRRLVRAAPVGQRRRLDHRHRLDDEPVARPLAHVLDRLPLPGTCAGPGGQHRRVRRRPAGPPEADPAERDRGDVQRHVDQPVILVGVGRQHALRDEGRRMGPVQLHRARRRRDRAEGRQPRQRQGLRRRVVRRDHQRLPELVAVENRAVRPELEHVRQPQGQARPHRHVRPSPLRHRRIRVHLQ